MDTFYNPPSIKQAFGLATNRGSNYYGTGARQSSKMAVTWRFCQVSALSIDKSVIYSEANKQLASGVSIELIPTDPGLSTSPNISGEKPGVCCVIPLGLTYPPLISGPFSGSKRSY